MPSPTFADLGVPQNITAALASRGILEPFEIQSAAIGDVLAGRDVCGRAPTGSGKTLAFGIPLVATGAQGLPYHPRSLILVPTRELADQITAELSTFAGRVRIHAIYGGVGYGGQRAALKRGVDILVACPGRLEDLIQQGSIRLKDVDKVVIDEADRMADMGFLPAVRRILDMTSSGRQTVLFSATLDGDVARIVNEYQNNPVRHEVKPVGNDASKADHVFWVTNRDDRVEVTSQIIANAWPSIVFCRTRHGADRLARQLEQKGIVAAPIHGGRSQSQRTRALEDFMGARVQALIATDVAARGIHVDGVSSVIHFDPPEDHKAYIHRSGRTARAGETGLVVSLLVHDQVKAAKQMQRQIKLDIAPIKVDASNLSGALTDLGLAPAAPFVPPPAARSSKPPSHGGRPGGGRGGRPEGRPGSPKAGKPRTGAGAAGPKPSGTQRSGTPLPAGPRSGTTRSGTPRSAGPRSTSR
ncbi:MAG: DEAD/DEAH box helicase [Actinomycetota bacterium]|nr:DEAD/DEAH box helicase [Actinomycetota bacterium]